ncbi:MAG: hypothetical protein IKS66_06490 [Oscillospiraceae bacterium]|nr:hypothetical protein [Oscillospiraceae bacterium]
MFDNIGGKIKALAKIICYIGIGIAVITGIVLMATLGDVLDSGFLAFLVGLVAIALGILAAWVGSFVLYGYGELIDSNMKIAENTSK